MTLDEFWKQVDALGFKKSTLGDGSTWIANPGGPPGSKVRWLEEVYTDLSAFHGQDAGDGMLDCLMHILIHGDPSIAQLNELFEA